MFSQVSFIFSLPHSQVSDTALLSSRSDPQIRQESQRSAHQLVPLRAPGSVLQGRLLLLRRVQLQRIPGTHIKEAAIRPPSSPQLCVALSVPCGVEWSCERDTGLSGLNSTMQRRETKQRMGRIHAKVQISPPFFSSILAAGNSFPTQATMLHLKSPPGPLQTNPQLPHSCLSTHRKRKMNE